MHNEFFRKLTLHDMHLTRGRGSYDSDVVGGGAREKLLLATGWQGQSVSSVSAKHVAPLSLAKLHAKVAGALDTGPSKRWL